jgi:RibD C-terminal domain
MARRIYSAITSADGYVEDPDGSFDWGGPTRNCSVSPTSLSGRRHLPVRAPDVRGDALLGDCRHGARPAVCVPGVHRLWQAAEKIMFSTTLESAPSTKTRIDRNFDPAMIRQLKSAIGHDMTVGGADLAGQAITAGLVNEVQLFLVPIIVGGGKPALPSGLRSELELLDTQQFTSGAVYLRYRLTPA